MFTDDKITEISVLPMISASFSTHRSKIHIARSANIQAKISQRTNNVQSRDYADNDTVSRFQLQMLEAFL